VAVFERSGRLSATNAAHVRRIIARLAAENERYTGQVMSEGRAHLGRNGMRQGTVGFPILIPLLITGAVAAGSATLIWGWTLKNQSAAVKACTDCMAANDQNASKCQHVCGALGPEAPGDGGTFSKIGKWAVVGLVGAIIVSKVIDKTLD
jgi:hypothetical protein